MTYYHDLIRKRLQEALEDGGKGGDHVIGTLTVNEALGLTTEFVRLEGMNSGMLEGIKLTRQRGDS